ncbi:hypothetical protein HDU92_002714 [Lobulomyces angularis]|nr:hypothetical protein HDU92_002714 [Lobulomyces angularis]
MTNLINALRLNDCKYLLLDGNNEETDSLLQTSKIKVESNVFDLTEQSGYKTYSNSSIINFIINKDLPHQQYIKNCSDSGNFQFAVSFMDRKDLIELLDTKLEINLSGNNDLKAGEKRNRLENSEKLELINKDKAEVSLINEKERVIRDRKNVMAVRGQRNFTKFQKLGAEFFDGKDKTKKISSSGLKKSDPRMKDKKNTSLSKVNGSGNNEKKQKTRHGNMENGGSNTGGSKGIPIILVPAGMTSCLNIYNVEDFLCEQKFIPSDVIRKSGKAKPLSVQLKRKFFSGSNGTSSNSGKNLQNFLVYDNVDRFTSSEWDRVVAVFALGQEWQFKNWKWSKPVDIFNHAVGFYLHFSDEPVKDIVKGWRVHILTIDKLRRHLDVQVVNEFWRLVDNFVQTRKPMLLS